MIRSVFKFGRVLNYQFKFFYPQTFNMLPHSSGFNFSSKQDPAAALDPKIVDEVESKVFAVLKSAAKCKTEKLSRGATFDELGFDSLDIVELVVAMEENFGVDIQDDEAERIQTVQDAIQVFYKHKSQPKPAAESK